MDSDLVFCFRCSADVQVSPLDVPVVESGQRLVFIHPPCGSRFTIDGYTFDSR